jgi:hypothetical protein
MLDDLGHVCPSRIQRHPMSDPIPVQPTAPSQRVRAASAVSRLSFKGLAARMAVWVCVMLLLVMVSGALT